MAIKQQEVITKAVKRQDILVLMDATDSNLNGDPDADNMPRIDPETQQGIVTDVCIKRKIRDYAALLGENLYVKHKGVLITKHKEAYDKTGQTPGKSSNVIARKFMCDNHWDIRAFGALMTGGTEKTEEDVTENKAHTNAKNTRFDCGAVRGPVQVSFARTIDPICPTEHAITRVALTNEMDGRGATKDAEGNLTANSGQMGHKFTIPYGLYKFSASVNPYLAKDTGFTEKDNEMLLNALVGMLENDASAARPNIAVRKVYVWTHDSERGSAPKHKLFDTVAIEKKSTVKYPRQLSDYSITVGNPPAGVTLTELVDGLPSAAKLNAANANLKLTGVVG